MGGAAAGATTQSAEYLGQYATVMDAEMLGIAISLETHRFAIALDSQGAITRAMQLYTEPARSWIEPRMQEALAAEPSCLIWVKGHSGVRGNEEADRRANLIAYEGRVVGRPDRVTPAGIRQEFPIHTKPKHLGWSRQSLKGLVYVMTDRGPLNRWLKVISYITG